MFSIIHNQQMSPSDSPDIVMQYQDSGSSYVPYKYL